MNRYESLFIIKPDQNEDQVQAVIDRLQQRMERARGKVASIDHWGLRSLAYPIQYRGERFHRGYYVLMTYIGDGAAVEEMEHNFKILDAIFRFLTVKQEDGVDPESVTEVEVKMPPRGARPSDQQPHAPAMTAPPAETPPAHFESGTREETTERLEPHSDARDSHESSPEAEGAPTEDQQAPEGPADPELEGDKEE